MRSAFGVDHGISKGLKNPLQAFKAARKPKPAAPHKYENPFDRPSTGGKGMSAQEFSAFAKPPAASRKGLMTPNSRASGRNAGLNAAYRGNQGGMRVQSRRSKDLG